MNPLVYAHLKATVEDFRINTVEHHRKKINTGHFDMDPFVKYAAQKVQKYLDIEIALADDHLIYYKTFWSHLFYLPMTFIHKHKQEKNKINLIIAMDVLRRAMDVHTYRVNQLKGENAANN